MIAVDAALQAGMVLPRMTALAICRGKHALLAKIFECRRWRESATAGIAVSERS